MKEIKKAVNLAEKTKYGNGGGVKMVFIDSSIGIGNTNNLTKIKHEQIRLELSTLETELDFGRYELTLTKINE